VRRDGINRAGLAALLPVRDGKDVELQARLEALSARTPSPFARIGSTHFARLVLVEELPGRNGDPLPDVPPCLLFAAEFDIPVDGYLEALCTLLPAEADAVFGTCAGYPGVNAPPLFAAWVKRNRVRAGFSLHGNPEARVGRVVDSLRLRERIIEFALDTRALDPASLKQAWDAQDWESAS
jgi:hypothetical protein